MAVQIPSDLVLDVMRAAEPSRVQAAARKLGAETAKAVASRDFERAMARPVAPSQEEAKPADAYSQFESFMIRDAFEDMLPKTQETEFGGGYAGSIWRSMAAEQYASIFTQHGGLGIAEMLRNRAGAQDAKSFPKSLYTSGTST